MRDLFRLIAVAAMSFAVVGLAMVYSHGRDTLVEAVSAVAQEARLQWQGAGAPGPHNGDQAAEHLVTIYAPNASAWTGLAGFPDQAEIDFALPRDAEVQGGSLILAFDSQLPEAGQGLVTLSVNGTPRGQMIIEGGNARHEARIALTPADLQAGDLVLQMAGRGDTGGLRECPAHGANVGGVVTLLAESRLELTVGKVPVDDIGALAQPLVLTPGSGQDDAALAVWAGQYLDRAGVDVRFGMAGPGETQIGIGAATSGRAGTFVLDGVDAIGALAEGVPPHETWPLSVAALGADTSIRSFRGSRQWGVRFAAADLPGGQLPSGLTLELMTTPLAANGEWVIRVALNGTLVAAQRYAGDIGRISAQFDLPEAQLALENTLQIDLVDTTPPSGSCGQSEQVQAQLLAETSLLAGEGPATTGWATLVAQLAPAAKVSLSVVPGLEPRQLDAASHLLGLLLSPTTQPDFNGLAAVDIIVTDRAGLAGQLAQLATHSLQAVLPVSGLVGQELAPFAVPGAGFGAALERLEADDVILLIAGL